VDGWMDGWMGRLFGGMNKMKGEKLTLDYEENNK
jgi:hypothetical protein